jgi:hypothetical protein
MKTALRYGIAIALLAGSSQAQIFHSGLLNQQIPDGNSSGMIAGLAVTGAGSTLTGIRVGLELYGIGEGGFAGDLYLTLEYNGRMAVLFNRLGARPGSPGGYGDSAGFNITLYDSAAADIHQYRLFTSGSENLSITGPLLGDWQPDGRNADPGGEVWDESRSQMLDAFAGMNPNGTWTLFASDLSTGGEFALKSWSLELTAVPEPQWTTGAAAGAAGLWAFLRRLRRNSSGLGDGEVGERRPE